MSLTFVPSVSLSPSFASTRPSLTLRRTRSPAPSSASRVPLRTPCMHAATSDDAEAETAKPVVSESSPASSGAVATDGVVATDGAVDDRTELEKENDRLRAAEKFIVVNEGKFECPGCDYMYEPTKGDFLNGIAKGTPYEDLPEDFRCPVCRTPKTVFQPVKKTIAGFADNQGYGFGTNSLTGQQKNGLIFGGLAFFFLLLLSGYALN